MPIYGEDARSLMEEFMKANEEENLSTKKLLALMESGCRDYKLLDSGVCK